MRKLAIIAAAGAGLRMKSDLPKPFLQLSQSLTILELTLQRFRAISDCRIVLMLSKEGLRQWEDLHVDKSRIEVMTGEKTRFHTIQKAVRSLQAEADDIVAIHDAVRPFVTTEIIQSVFDNAAKYGTAVTAIAPSDSIRIYTKEQYKLFDRNKVRLMQTPQAFSFQLLEKAYQQDYQEMFTDDATVVETLGVDLKFVPGNHLNFKITHPEDLLLAKAIYNLNNQDFSS